MLGHTHALTGLAAGAATLPAAAPILGGLDTPTAKLAWVVCWGGFALLPDLDAPGSTIARLWGPATNTAARIVGWLFRGHRAGTHDPLLAPAILGAAAWAAAHWWWGRLTLTALAVGLGLRAIGAAIPGREAWDPWPVNLAASWATGYALVAATPGWLPYAVAGGVLVHIVFDAPTEAGIPAPFTWLRPRGPVMVKAPAWLAPKAGNPAANTVVCGVALAATAWLCAPWAATALTSIRP